MQITESIKKDGFASLDSDYRIQPSVQGQFTGKQKTSNTEGSSSTLQPPLFNRADEILQNKEFAKVPSADGTNAGDTSNKEIPGFTSPPPTSHPAPRPPTAKPNTRSKLIEINRYGKHSVHSAS